MRQSLSHCQLFHFFSCCALDAEHPAAHAVANSHVLQSLDAYADVLRSGPAVVMGDLNSGTNLSGRKPPSKNHSRLVSALEGLGLVTAYHAFHHAEQGQEKHPTFRRNFKEPQRWHIDFCFIPTNWITGLVSVELIDGQEWMTRSDHPPLHVALRLA